MNKQLVLMDKLSSKKEWVDWWKIISDEIKDQMTILMSSGFSVLNRKDFFWWSNNFKLYFIQWSIYQEFILPQTQFMLKFIKENQELYNEIVSKMTDYQNDRSIKRKIDGLLYEAYLIIRQYPESPSNYDICK